MPTPATSTTNLPKPPLGIIDSITSGFEVVNSRLALAVLPLALDLFLWLGPKLSIQPLMPPLFKGLQFLYTYGGDASMAQQFEAVRSALTDFAAQYNVFSALSIPALGLPSFMWGRMPATVPPGYPAVVVPVTDPLFYVVLLGAFTLAGLFLGALFFGTIAQQVGEKRMSWLKLGRQVWFDWARLTVFGLLVLLILGMVTVPVMMIGSLIAQFIPLVGALLSAAALTLGMWLLFYVGFTVQGIVLRRRGLFGAVWDSLRVVQGSMAHTAGLYGLILIISWGLSVLWNLASPDSWVMLAALAGHALVSTALVAATFVFYQDRYRWWAEMRQVRAAQGARPNPQAKRNA